MDYTKECWYCRKLAMEPKGNYYQCTECGATWNEQPALTSFIDVTSEKVLSTAGQKGKPSRRSGKIKGGPPLPPLRGMTGRAR